MRTVAVEPSAATLRTCTSLIVGTICSAIALAEPTTRTTPLMASIGTSTCSCVPAGFTEVARTMRSPTLPDPSVTWNTTSVVASSPLPLSVMLWPALAVATPTLVGVPLAPLALMLVRPMPKAALVPPTVVTRTGPVAAPAGTVRLMPVALLKTSRP